MRMFSVLMVFLSLAAPSLQAGDAALRELRHSKPLLPIEGAQLPLKEAPMSFELDSEVYASTRPGFPDMRLDSGSATIPHSVRRVEGASVKVKRSFECPAKLVSFTKTPGNRVEIVLERLKDLPDSGLAASSVRISTRTRNYEKRVRVQAGPGPDGPWSELCDESPVFDYSDLIDFSRNSVSFSACGSPFIKVTISNYSEDGQSPVEGVVREFRAGANVAEYRRTLHMSTALRIDAISLFGERELVGEVPELLRDYPLASFSCETSGQETLVTVKTRHEPLRSLCVQTESSYFMRRVLVEAAGEKPSEWRPLASCVMHSIGGGPSRDSSLSIEFPETRASAYRLRISNGDAPPLLVAGVTAKGAVYRVEFIAKPEAVKGLRLLYSSDAVGSPDYDIAGVLAKLKAEPEPQLRLGAQAPNGLYGGDALRFDSKTILYIVALAAAALMALLIYKGIGKVDKN